MHDTALPGLSCLCTGRIPPETAFSFQPRERDRERDSEDLEAGRIFIDFMNFMWARSRRSREGYNRRLRGGRDAVDVLVYGQNVA